MVTTFYPDISDKIIKEDELCISRHLNMHPVLRIVFSF